MANIIIFDKKANCFLLHFEIIWTFFPKMFFFVLGIDGAASSDGAEPDRQ
jgi:hypothetical protein